MKAPPNYMQQFCKQFHSLKPHTVLPRQDLSQGVTLSCMYLTLGKGACVVIEWVDDHALRLLFVTLHC